MIGGIFAGLKALSVVSKVSGALSFIPGVGVLPGIVSAVCGAILGFVRIIFQGLTVIVTNPATVVTVGVIALGSMAWGVKMGNEWTGRRVEAAVAVATKERARADKLVTDLATTGATKAKEAADAATTAPQPETPTEIAALCQRSASCRERSK